MSALQHVANIGDRGARRRLISGVVWIVIDAGVLIALLVTGAPRVARLILAIPVGLSAIGFLQARERT